MELKPQKAPQSVHLASSQAQESIIAPIVIGPLVKSSQPPLARNTGPSPWARNLIMKKLKGLRENTCCQNSTTLCREALDDCEVDLPFDKSFLPVPARGIARLFIMFFMVNGFALVLESLVHRLA